MDFNIIIECKKGNEELRKLEIYVNKEIERISSLYKVVTPKTCQEIEKEDAKTREIIRKLNDIASSPPFFNLTEEQKKMLKDK